MSRSAVELSGVPDSVYHWIAGELVVVIRLPRRPPDDALDTLAEQVRSQLNHFLAPHGLILETYGTMGRWLNRPSLPTARRHVFIFGLHRQQPLAAIFFHARHSDPSVPDAAPMAISYLQGQLERLAQIGLYLVSAMPNWLVGAAPAFYADGGPAVPPRPARQLDLPPTRDTSDGWHLSFLDPAIAFDPNGAQNVVVAVLDTAPTSNQLYRAASLPELSQHWLIQRLVADMQSGSGSFEIEYDRYPVLNDVGTGRNAQGAPYYYRMQDHGLFVAGLIRDVAPRAHIRLIRVLNDFGGGDLYNLFAALTDLEQELVSGSIRRLVINLSLTTLPDIHRLPYVWFYQRQWSSSQLMGAIRMLAHIEAGLQLLFESLSAHGVLIVAAAGNDSLGAQTQGQLPRPPRAPARYPTTLSVTAVNSRFAPARFANAACMPPLNAGVATFGGDSVGVTDSNGLPEAVRGIFISSTFPEGEPNIFGWADWSGSSFATPIISGLGAHFLAQGWSAANTITRFSMGLGRRSEQLFGSRLDVPSLLANGVRVRQQFYAPSTKELS